MKHSDAPENRCRLWPSPNPPIIELIDYPQKPQLARRSHWKKSMGQPGSAPYGGIVTAQCNLSAAKLLEINPCIARSLGQALAAVGSRKKTGRFFGPLLFALCVFNQAVSSHQQPLFSIW
jgi:hypothetical protein